MLLGRVGRDQYGRLVVSFWNSDSSNYANGKLAYCMQELEREVLPDNEEVVVSTPIGSYSYAEHTKETENLAKATELSLEKQKEYQELLKKMHTLRGDEKKAAMKKLGLGWKTPGKHPWQKSQEKVGMLGPGQKWWAPQSESRQ